MTTATNKMTAKGATEATGKPKTSGLGLDSMGDLSALLDAPTPGAYDGGGGPMMLDMDLIDEDPNQPRTEDNPGFSDESLDELTAREIADHIGRELAKDIKKGEIAKGIGKSAAFVTQHVTLLDLPDPIADAFSSGRVKDVTVVNELVTAFKKKSQEVTYWLGDENQEITRGSAKLLREFLDDKRKNEDDERDPNTVDALTGKTDAEAGDGEQGSGSDSKKEKEPEPDKLKKAIIQVQHDDRPARLILNRRPPADGWAWLKYEDDGQEFEANLAKVRLVALMEG